MKIFKIILITLFIFQTNCGYKIVNNIDNFKFTIIDYKLTGEKRINNLLDKNFRRFEDNISQSISSFIVHANSSINRSITSKNSSGEALSYDLKITIVIEVYENNNLLDKTSFDESTSYDNLNSKFELKQYENILIQDLTNKIIYEINNKLNSIK